MVNLSIMPAARRILPAVWTALLSASMATAGYKDDIRYTMLAGELGAALPNGAGVHVFQVEARIDVTNPANFVPDSADPEFVGKSIIPSPANGEVSDHATGVGQHFYGTVQSIAPGISTIDAFWADHFLGTGFLRNGSLSPPLKSDARVYNHSWVGDGNSNLNILKRMDFVIEAYDQLQVVGVNNLDGGNMAQPIFASAYNVISVGKTNGQHTHGSTSVGNGLYTAGRTKPDVVTPRNFTSQATPIVAALSALLVETAHANPALSKGAYDVEIASGMYTVQHGEASEVIKAALMAGAQRNEIPSYSASTTNGLDLNWGAGELDVYNSYHIIAGGEQDSSQQAGYASQWTGPGFDYDPSFAYDETATYYFVPGESSTSLAATLAWNIDIDGGGILFDGTATLADFDLLLYETTESGKALLASSASQIENTENIWVTGLNPGTEYVLEVIRSDSLESFPWDYGLAWSVAQDATINRFGDMNGDGQVNLTDVRPFMLALTNPSAYEVMFPGLDAMLLGDLNRDGALDNLDIDALAAVLGGGPLGDLGLGEVSPAVPEPTTASLCAMGALLLWLTGRHRRRVESRG